LESPRTLGDFPASGGLPEARNQQLGLKMGDTEQNGNLNMEKVMID
jgi:hypothetical protein